jgi:hypothetical protein
MMSKRRPFEEKNGDLSEYERQHQSKRQRKNNECTTTPLQKTFQIMKASIFGASFGSIVFSVPIVESGLVAVAVSIYQSLSCCTCKSITTVVKNHAIMAENSSISNSLEPRQEIAVKDETLSKAIVESSSPINSVNTCAKLNQPGTNLVSTLKSKTNVSSCTSNHEHPEDLLSPPTILYTVHNDVKRTQDLLIHEKYSQTDVNIGQDRRICSNIYEASKANFVVIEHSSGDDISSSTCQFESQSETHDESINVLIPPNKNKVKRKEFEQTDFLDGDSNNSDGIKPFIIDLTGNDDGSTNGEDVNLYEMHASLGATSRSIAALKRKIEVTQENQLFSQVKQEEEECSE